MAPKIVEFVEDAGTPGVIAGIGAVILAPVVLPVVGGIGKTVIKSLVKGGIVAFEKSRGALAELGESWEDMMAEVRAELTESDQTLTDEPTPEINNQTTSVS